MIQVWIGPSAAVEEGTWAQFQAKPGVSGVGVEAHWDVSANWLLVKIGAGYALFSVVGASVTDPAAASISLARLVIPKLGGDVRPRMTCPRVAQRGGRARQLPRPR